MSVVLRCPSCGTTRAALGECEACSDAQVQYFCTNHSPGVWLTTQRCGSCGAVFGEAPRRPDAAPGASPVKRVSARPVPSSAPALRTPSSMPRPPSRSYGREPSGSELERELPAPATWHSVLGTLLRSRYLPPPVVRERSGPGLTRGAGGCVLRLLLLALFLFLALVAGLFLFGRSLVEGLQPY